MQIRTEFCYLNQCQLFCLRYFYKLSALSRTANLTSKKRNFMHFQQDYYFTPLYDILQLEGQQ